MYAEEYGGFDVDDVDGDVADSIVQLAIFEEIVYG